MKSPITKYDDTGNSCLHQSAHACDFTGDAGDRDWICECGGAQCSSVHLKQWCVLRADSGLLYLQSAVMVKRKAATTPAKSCQAPKTAFL